MRLCFPVPPTPTNRALPRGCLVMRAMRETCSTASRKKTSFISFVQLMLKSSKYCHTKGTREQAMFFNTTLTHCLAAEQRCRSVTQRKHKLDALHVHKYSMHLGVVALTCTHTGSVGVRQTKDYRMTQGSVYLQHELAQMVRVCVFYPQTCKEHAHPCTLCLPLKEHSSAFSCQGTPHTVDRPWMPPL